MAENEKNTVSNIVKIILLCILLVVVVMLAETSLRSDGKKENAVSAAELPALVLDGVRPDPQKRIIERKYIGYVTPVHSVSVLPFISGFVGDVRVSGGQRVKKGDVLAVLQQQEYAARLSGAQAAIEQASAALQNAQSYYKRLTAAGAQAVSAADKDKAQAAYLTAKAALSQAKADYALAKVNYDYTIIKATVTGVVGNVSLTKGEYVSPAGAPLFRIIQTSPIRVVFSVTDKDYLNIADADGFADTSVRLILPNGEAYDQTGSLEFTDNAIDRQTNSMAMYALFDNPDGKLVTNAYVTVLTQRPYADTVAILQKSVSFSDKGARVQVINNGVLASKAVDILDQRDNVYIVKNVFAKDDFVLSSPIASLPSNRSVRLNAVTPSGE